MSDFRFVLIGGGARSGKSAFALSLARSLGRRRTFIATAEAKDVEMKNRILRHKEERGEEFQTVEEPFDLPQVIDTLKNTDVAVIDCLTLWLSNLLLRDETENQILQKVGALISAIEKSSFPVLLVTNEVGMGLVPETPLGRAFRDLTGRAHQALGNKAQEIYFATLGTILKIKPALTLIGETKE